MKSQNTKLYTNNLGFQTNTFIHHATRYNDYSVAFLRLAVACAMALCLTFAVAANAATLYKNGPTNGLCDIQQCEIDAWTVNFGYAVSNSFSVAHNSTITGANFYLWALPGDQLLSIRWSVGVTPFDDIAAGTATTLGGPGGTLTQTFVSSNGYGYDIDNIALSDISLKVFGNTTYWLTLQDAVVANGDPIYWDENNGPSSAQENQLGTIPSESFNLTGSSGGGGTVPEPSSIMLFGSGIIGLAGVLRRRLLG
jgi:PEP-CTERM motif